MIEQPGTGAGTAKGTVSIVEPTRAQRTVARRVAEAKATIPEVTLSTELDLETVVAGGGDPLPAVIVACAGALRDVPRANAAYRDGGFELYSRVNVGVVIATAEGLVVPTIFDADTKDAADIADELAALRGRAAGGELTSPELAGGTFTVAPLGAAAGTAVIHAGQAGILALGVAAPRAVARDGELTLRTVAQATLVSDHRILYGADAERFLARLAERLA
jgi:pyruvate dehydrogenase E2 component (dihydrolipoamide acetyltransferase)